MKPLHIALYLLALVLFFPVTALVTVILLVSRI